MRIRGDTRSFKLTGIPLFFLLELEGEVALAIYCFAGTEIVRLEKLADLNFAFLALSMGRRDALSPFNGLFPGLRLNDPVSGDEFLGLGKRAVDDSALASRKFDAGALGAGLE